jgi:hypothetical protein
MCENGNGTAGTTTRTEAGFKSEQYYAKIVFGWRSAFSAAIKTMQIIMGFSLRGTSAAKAEQS